MKEYFRTLDIFRFFAFLAVFVSHISLVVIVSIHSPFWQNLKELLLIHGDIGVNFFFTLSGFLITYLLFKEKDSRGTIDIKKFFVRRVLRIWPVYFITVGVVFAGIPLAVYFLHQLGLTLPAEALTGTDPHRLPLFFAFLVNFGWLLPGHDNLASGVLWSISVEEQFYLLWPWVILYVPRKHLLKVFGLLIALSTIHRLYYTPDWSITKYSTLSVFSDFVCGALFAYLICYIPNFRQRLSALSQKYVWTVLVGILFLLPISTLLARQVVISGGVTNTIVAFLPLLFCLAFGFIIAKKSCDPSGQYDSPLTKIFIYLGKISYGLYCYHGLAILTAKVVPFILPGAIKGQVIIYTLEILMAGLLTLGFATISFHYIETPILSLKKRFEQT